jgi:hypothetical protein
MTFWNRGSGLIAGALIAWMAVCFTSPVRAQDEVQAPPADAPVPQNEAAGGAGRARMRPLSSVISNLSRSTGISIVADSPLIGQNVPAPSGDVTAADLEGQLTAITKALPSGVLWAKLYLPAAANSRGYNGDALASYALAQAKLFGNVGAPTTPGTIEVMGQKVGADKADTVIAALSLKPVYVILNPMQHNNGSQANVVTPANSANWTAMTPQQRQQYAQQQAQNIMNMDPQSRQQAMQSMMEQQRAVMQALMQSMTPEQRQQMLQGVRPNGPGRRGQGGTNGAPPF